MSFTHTMVTIDAVFEATLQVLLSEGPRRLTTTRVAERAGVSVGTIYQYYPNKESLLYAVLQRHLDHVAQAVETACRQQRGQSLDAMIKAFVEAKTARIDESRALYAIAAELNTAELVRKASERMRAAAIAMLETATDAKFDDLPMVTFIWLNALVGPTRATLEGRAARVARAAGDAQRRVFRTRRCGGITTRRPYASPLRSGE